MVAIQRESFSPRRTRRVWLLTAAAILLIVCLVLLLGGRGKEQAKSHDDTGGIRTVAKPQEVLLEPVVEGNAQEPIICPYMSFDDLTQEERYPQKGPRHMVQPPKGGELTLVCCATTKGPWNVVVHNRWAPLGAQRFLEMVQRGYFNHGVPLFRCLKNFLCQFGLSSQPEISREFKSSIKDDPNWLPEGPTHRQNSKGVKRFAQGYLGYAGGGKDSRDRQFIVSLVNVATLAGGSPWEVPWGELVGKHSFDTLSKIYFGYDEDGPKQGMLIRKGMTDEMKAEFPELDHITSCHIVDREVQEVTYE